MLRRVAKMALISVEEIPTMALLYKLKKIEPSLLGPVPTGTSAHNEKIGIIRGDITTMAVDAIVNAANTSLLGGGGVDGAIHRAAGRGLLAECKTLKGCATGSSKITNAYELPCRKVIHTVGPVYSDINVHESQDKLHGCYKSSLQLAVDNGVKTIAFSGISTGVYGYPPLDAAVIACRTVKEFLDGEDGKKLDKVVFVTFERKDVLAYSTILPRFFPEKDPPPISEQIAEAEAQAAQLPSVPKTDPADDEHVQKKQKQDDGS
ncbi:MACRO domain-containing protein [Xylariaceae sp. FL1019]|nr:MACRO domain-containing protein [Xylariaceae sp. FL1019]